MFETREETHEANDQDLESHHPLSTSLGPLEEGQDNEDIHSGQEHYDQASKINGHP